MANLWIVDIMSVIFLMSTQEFGSTVMMPISQKSVNSRKGIKVERVANQKKRKLITGSKYKLFVVYIRTNHLIESSLSSLPIIH